MGKCVVELAGKPVALPARRKLLEGGGMAAQRLPLVALHPDDLDDEVPHEGEHEAAAEHQRSHDRRVGVGRLEHRAQQHGVDDRCDEGIGQHGPEAVLPCHEDQWNEEDEHQQPIIPNCSAGGFTSIEATRHDHRVLHHRAERGDHEGNRQIRPAQLLLEPGRTEVEQERNRQHDARPRENESVRRRAVAK